MVSDVLVRQYYISAGVPQPSASSSNPNLHFKASKHQLLMNHNIFGCAFAIYCFYKYAKVIFKLSSDSASINLGVIMVILAQGGTGFPTISSANMQKSERKQRFFLSFQSRQRSSRSCNHLGGASASPAQQETVCVRVPHICVAANSSRKRPRAETSRNAVTRSSRHRNWSRSRAKSLRSTYMAAACSPHPPEGRGGGQSQH